LSDEDVERLMAEKWSRLTVQIEILPRGSGIELLQADRMRSRNRRYWRIPRKR